MGNFFVMKDRKPTLRNGPSLLPTNLSKFKYAYDLELLRFQTKANF